MVRTRIGLCYELIDEISSGGMGSAWRGYDTVLGREVAIKLIQHTHPSSVAEAAELAERFRREARITARGGRCRQAVGFGQRDGSRARVSEISSAHRSRFGPRGVCGFGRGECAAHQVVVEDMTRRVEIFRLRTRRETPQAAARQVLVRPSPPRRTSASSCR